MLWNGLFVVFMIPFYFNSEVSIPHKWDNLIIASLLSAVCCALYVICTYRIDVSVLSPMYNIRTGFSVLFGFLLLGETLTPYKIFLIGIIIVMGLLVSLDEKFSFRSFLTKNRNSQVFGHFFISLVLESPIVYFSAFSRRILPSRNFFPLSWLHINNDLPWKSSFQVRFYHQGNPQ